MVAALPRLTSHQVEGPLKNAHHAFIRDNGKGHPLFPDLIVAGDYGYHKGGTTRALFTRLTADVKQSRCPIYLHPRSPLTAHDQQNGMHTLGWFEEYPSDSHSDTMNIQLHSHQKSVTLGNIERFAVKNAAQTELAEDYRRMTDEESSFYLLGSLFFATWDGFDWENVPEDQRSDLANKLQQMSEVSDIVEQIVLGAELLSVLPPEHQSMSNDDIDELLGQFSNVSNILLANHEPILAGQMYLWFADQMYDLGQDEMVEVGLQKAESIFAQVSSNVGLRLVANARKAWLAGEDIIPDISTPIDVDKTPPAQPMRVGVPPVGEVSTGETAILSK